MAQVRLLCYVSQLLQIQKKKEQCTRYLVIKFTEKEMTPELKEMSLCGRRSQSFYRLSVIFCVVFLVFI